MNILILFLFSSISFAKTFTPADLSKLAVERASYIKMYLENKSASESSIKQAKTLGNPTLFLQTGKLRSAGESGGIIDLTLSQPFAWPGKRAALVESQKILAKISEVELEEAKLLIAHRVNNLSFQMALATELEKHHEERRKRFRFVFRYLSTRPMASPKQQIEKEMIENQMRMFEKMMMELSASKAGMLQELSLWTGINKPNLQVAWDKLPPLPSKEKYQSELDQSPRLKKSQRHELLAESRIEEARLEARPDIVVGVNYRQENVAPTNHFYHAQIGVVIPIIDRGQNSVEVARANARRTEAMSKLTQQELSTEFHQIYPKIESLVKSMKIFSLDNIDRLEKSFLRAEEAFRKGQIDVVTFIQTDDQLHEYVDEAYTTRVKYLAGLSELEMLTGQNLEY